MLKFKCPFDLMGAMDALSVKVSVLISLRFKKSSNTLMERVLPALGDPLNSITSGRFATGHRATTLLLQP
jgi:hypothetical protein